MAGPDVTAVYGMVCATSFDNDLYAVDLARLINGVLRPSIWQLHPNDGLRPHAA